ASGISAVICPVAPAPASAPVPPFDDPRLAARRDSIAAEIAALPRTAPTCRTVLYTPDPAPAWCSGRCRVAVELLEYNVRPLGRPNSSTGGLTAHREVAVSRIDPIQNRAVEKDPSPLPARMRGSP